MKTLIFKSSLLLFLLVFLSNHAFCQNNTDGDDRMKIRLGFTSVTNMHREILIALDNNATQGIDYGYDAEYYDNYLDDMYWMIEDRKFLIQGTNLMDATTIYPLGLHTSINGSNIFTIKELINIPEDLEIGILDKVTNVYYDIKQTSSFSIQLDAGEYLDRFELKFDNNNNNNNDDNEDAGNDVADNEAPSDIISEEIEPSIAPEEVAEDSAIQLNYINRIHSISIKNIGEQKIKSVKVFSIIGQQIATFDNINAVDQTLIKTYNLNTGNYILLVTTDLGNITKKVAVK